jgi:hypothetical protein
MIVGQGVSESSHEGKHVLMAAITNAIVTKEVVFAEDLHDDGRASVHEREQLDGPGVDAAQDLELILNTLCPIVFREGVSEKAFQTFLLRLFGLRWAHAGSSANPKAHRADAPGSIGVARATMGGMGAK